MSPRDGFGQHCQWCQWHYSGIQGVSGLSEEQEGREAFCLLLLLSRIMPDLVRTKRT